MSELELCKKLFAAEISKRELRDVYKTGDLPEVIRAAVWESVSRECDFRLTEEGELRPTVKNEPLDLYRDNRRVTVADLLKPFEAKYFKAPETRGEPQADPLEELPPNLRHMHYRARGIW
jgi:hypothetical protein